MRRLAAVCMLLLVGACSSGAQPSEPAALRVVATPAATGKASVDVDLATSSPSSQPPAAATAAAAAAPTPLKVQVPPVPAVGIGAFKHLGSWIDVYDHTDDPDTVLPLVRGVAQRGSKTLYLETARYATPGVFQFPKAMGAALDEAKSLGLKVVAWYPPDFKDVAKDLKRSVAAIEYRSPGGNRFDAFASDIEYTQGVPDTKTRNARVIDYSKRLHKAAGALYPLAAIVIPPTSLEVNPTRWPDFPWEQIKASYEVFMPMNYWTARGKDAKTAAELTRDNVMKTKAFTGKPVHIIGGLGENADEAQTAAYVKAAREAGSIGGGMYDYRTTRADVWDELRKLNG